MDGDDILGMLLVLALFGLAGLGGLSLVMDLRHYPQIVKQCEERGFIQNENIRVLCSVEKR